MQTVEASPMPQEFAGYQIIAPSALSIDPRDVIYGSSVELIYRPLIRSRAHVCALGLPRTSMWHNVGTPEEYSTCQTELMTKQDRQTGELLARTRPNRGVWTGQCLVVTRESKSLENVSLDQVDQLNSLPGLISLNEIEGVSLRHALDSFLQQVRVLPLVTSKGSGGLDLFPEGLPLLIMQLRLEKALLVNGPPSILVGGECFLEFALSQRSALKAPKEWTALLITAGPEEL
jgi:hypothetical protein